MTPRPAMPQRPQSPRTPSVRGRSRHSRTTLSHTTPSHTTRGPALRPARPPAGLPTARLPTFLTALLAALLVLGGLTSAQAQVLRDNPLLLDVPNKPVPALEFTAETMDGKPLRLSDYRGQVVLLNFWATWCTPCLLEMPAMERLNRKMAGKPFKMLAVNQGEPRAQIARWSEKHPFSFDLVLDPLGEIGTNYGANRLPMTYLIDRKGFVVRRAIGPREWDSDVALEMFERLMAEPAAATPATAATGG